MVRIGRIAPTVTILADPSTYTLGTTMTATIDILDNLPPEFLTKGETDPTVRTTDKFYFYMGADQFSNGSFQRYLSAQDPEGDAITWSISDSSGNFTIDLTTGLLKLTATAAIDQNETYTFNATVTSFGGTDTAVVTVSVMTISLKTIDFTTDHDLLRKPQASNPTFASNGGARYHDIEWKADPSGYADPLTHTMSTRVTLDVRLTGVPAGMSYDLLGDAEGSDLDFTKSGASGNTETVTAEDPLPANVGQVNKAITWTITIDGQTVELGDSQNLIYVTYGRPLPIGGTVTETRMEWLTDVAEGLSDPHEIVAAIHEESLTLGKFKLDNTPPAVWSFLDGKFAECIDHVKLIQAGVGMLGVLGGEVGFVFPRTDPNVKGVYSSTYGQGFQTAVINGIGVRLTYFNGGRNMYEAVFKFSSNGTTKYYAGFSEVFNTPKEVMEGVVQALQWWAWSGVQIGGQVGDNFGPW